MPCAFEAAVWHLSFAKASEELNVTPAAIISRLKARRTPSGPAIRAKTASISKSPAFSRIRDGFDKMTSSVQSLQRRKEHGFITVSATPSFASKWLVPRLDRWVAEHPETDVRISASLDLVDFEKTAIDLAIRFGAGAYAGLTSTFLMKESFVVVCSPMLVRGNNAIETPADLKNHTLLHVLGPNPQYGEDWRNWLQAAGVEGIDSERGLYFDDTAAFASAIGGQGVLLSDAQ